MSIRVSCLALVLAFSPPAALSQQGADYQAPASFPSFRSILGSLQAHAKFRQALCNYEQNRFERAVELLDQELALQEATPWQRYCALDLRGRIRLDQERFAEAIDDFEAALNAAPFEETALDARITLARALAAAGDLSGVVVLCDEVLEHPQCDIVQAAGALYEMAWALSCYDPSLAADTLREIIEIEGLEGEWENYIWQAYGAAGYLHQMIGTGYDVCPLLDKLLSHEGMWDFTRAQLLAYTGYQRIVQGDTERGEELFAESKKLMHESISVPGIFNDFECHRASAYAVSAQPDKALEILDALIATQGLSARYRVQAEVDRADLFMIAGDAPAALNEFNRLASLEGLDDELKAQVLCSRTVALMELEAWQEALADCDAVIAMDGAVEPWRFYAGLDRMMCLAHLGEEQRMMPQLKAAMDNRDLTVLERAQSHLYLAVLILESGRLDDAIAKLTSLVQQNWGFADIQAHALYYRGLCHETAGRRDEALEDYKSAIDIPSPAALLARSKAARSLKRLLGE